MTLSDDAPHVLVVDDDRRLRELLRKFLMENGYRVTTASDAEQARAKLAGLAYDLVILDVMMPGETGLEFIRSLRLTDNVPVMMLTARGDVEDRIAGLERGADDYLVKPFEPRELVLRIESILRRTPSERSQQARVSFGDFAFDLASGMLECAGEPVRLTTSEAALLRILATSPGVAIGRDELGERAASGQGRAIDVQITRLRRKIEANPKVPRFLQTVRGEGYVLWTD